MHVSSGFLLLETVPGREAQLLEVLARIPAVTHRSLLYPAAIALKIEAPDVAHVQAQLKRLEGVIGARLYRARNA
jgi:hypothetical protein